MAERALRGNVFTALREPVLARYRTLAGRPLLTLAWTALSAYAACVVVAFANSRSVWLDEAVSIAIATQPLAVIAALVQHVDAVHALYYTLLHFWLAVGHSAIAIRMLSAIFSILALFEIANLAQRLFGRAAAPAAIAVLATSVFFVFYADEARPPALTLLACSLTTLRYWRFVRYGRTRDAVLCGVFAIVSIYADVVACAYIIALAASTPIVHPRRETLGRLAFVALVVAVAAMPLALLIQQNSFAQVSWIARSGPTQIVNFLVSLLAGDAAFGRPAHVFTIVAAALTASLLIVGFTAAMRKPASRQNACVAAVWLVMPLAIGIAVDRWLQPILIPRYFSFELIPIAVLAGYGLATVAQKGRLTVAVAIVATLGSMSIHNLLAVQREDWRDVTHLVAADARPGDGLVFWAPIVIAPYEFALREAKARPVVPIAYPDRPLLDDRDYQRPAHGFTRRLGRHFRRVWFIQSHDLSPGGAANPFSDLSQLYAHRQEHQFAGIRVTVFSR